MGQPITRDAFGLCDPLRVRRAARAVEHSNRALAASPPASDGSRRVQATVIDALGNGLSPSRCRGSVNIGRCIFEDTDLSGAAAGLRKYDELLVASTWNAQMIEAATGRTPQLIFEGVDTSLFCPGPRSGLMDTDTFHVFSGGKIEHRKGQDLVLLAFRIFHRRHPDSVLVTAWHSPWPRLSAGFKGQLEHAIELGSDGRLDVAGWVSRNGLEAGSVVDLGFVPNALLPSVLREMDVALQPSRAEACTNLPAKEAMACGIPVIAAMNTGMKDLLTDDNCIPLRRQTDVTGAAHSHTEGWGESDVDEIVSALEYSYEHRDDALAIGSRSRAWLIEHDRTWAAHAGKLKRWLLSDATPQAPPAPLDRT